MHHFHVWRATVAVAAFLGAGARALPSQSRADSATTLVIAGRLFDSERGILLSGQSLLVRNGRIDSVGSGITPRPGMRVVDLRNYTVIPGLIDMHTHLFHSVSREGMVDEVVREGPALRSLRAAWRAGTYIRAGFTTVRDLGNSGQYLDVALRTAVDEGSIEGPRIVASGPGLIAHPMAQFQGLQPEYEGIARAEYRVISSADDAVSAILEHTQHGADLLKVYSWMPPVWFDTIVSIARQIRSRRPTFMVTAHATDDFTMQTAIRAGVDAIEHGYNVTDSTLQQMARKNIALVPTDWYDSVHMLAMFNASRERLGQKLANQAEAEEDVSSRRERLRRAVKAGVTIVFGSDEYVPLGIEPGPNARSILMGYKEAGMTNVQVLQSATLNSARLLGMQGKVGVLKKSASADIVALDGDPLTDIQALTRPVYVMIRGKDLVDRRR